MAILFFCLGLAVYLAAGVITVRILVARDSDMFYGPSGKLDPEASFILLLALLLWPAVYVIWALGKFAVYVIWALGKFSEFVIKLVVKDDTNKE